MSILFSNPPAIQIMEEFRINGKTFIRSPNARRIFALLALQAGNFVPMARLTHELWGGHTIRNPNGALYVLLSQIRNATNRAFEIEHSESRAYRLVVEQDEVDALRFMKLVDLALASEASEDFIGVLDYALAALEVSSRTEFFSGLLLGPMLKDWKTRLQSQARVALLCWTDATLRIGSPAIVLDRLYSVWLAEIGSEDFAMRLMIALYMLARTEEALRVFTATQNTLQSSMRVTLHPQLIQIQNIIIQGGRPDSLLDALRPIN